MRLGTPKARSCHRGRNDGSMAPMPERWSWDGGDIRARPLPRPERRCMSQPNERQKGNRGAKVGQKSKKNGFLLGRTVMTMMQKIWTLWESNPRPHAIYGAKHARYQLCQGPIAVLTSQTDSAGANHCFFWPLTSVLFVYQILRIARRIDHVLDACFPGERFTLKYILCYQCL